MSAGADAANFRFEFSRHAAAADLHPTHAEEFGRLALALSAGPRSQFLFVEFRNQLYRDRLLLRLNDVARDAQLRVLNFDLADYKSFAELESGLLQAASEADVIHVLGGERWFDANRWRDFNLRREAVAREVAVRLLIWLDPEQVPVLVTNAADLWAWRAGIYDFVEPDGRPATAVSAQWAPVIDNRALNERSPRMAELRRMLTSTDIPDAARVMLLDELAALCFDMGDLDEALRIRRDEQLPVFEKLGDVRSRAVTLGKMADVYQARGDLDEALRIRRDEELPVYEKLGDVRSRAMTQAMLGQIWMQKGDIAACIPLWRSAHEQLFRMKLPEAKIVQGWLDRVTSDAPGNGKPKRR